MENPFKKLGEEWKKASPKEKLFIVGAAASIVAVALYLHNKASSSAVGGTGTTGLPASLSPGTGGTAATGSTGTTAPGSLLNTGSTDQGTFGNFAPPANAPSYTTPPAPPINTSVPAGARTPAQAGASVAQNILSSRRTPPGAQVATNVLSAHQQAIANYIPPPYTVRSQPTATTQVYGTIRHAPAPAPISTQQVQPLRQIPTGGRPMAG